MKNFYNKLNKPFYALAPLAGITDSAFRQICKGFGADILYSEMISATALFYNDRKTIELMSFNEAERPYVVQLFGSESKHFKFATELIQEQIRPDGIDINFGCPVPKVVKQGAGIALFKNLKKSREVIKAVIDSTDLPVSIKTRSKVKDIDVLKFLDHMKGLNIAAIMIHGRSSSQGFSGPVDAEIIKKARNYFKGIVIANGGVSNYEDAQFLFKESCADGIGIGQGALGRPWIFKAARTGQSVERSPRAIFKVAIEHARLSEELKGKQGILEMRKHLCWYASGLPGARELRRDLVKVETLKDIYKLYPKEVPCAQRA
ncbi:tRNA-dihydrouridine synthase, partial [Candidatus Parcubacteria bacterium]|nr:tRNA-dihydrouridine synthase [Candidatus Parcubacteria bacterium]